MTNLTEDHTFPVTDLKQWAYCPRVFYYQHCLPNIRPETHLMKAGTAAGQQEEGREERRSLRPYGLTLGERAFNVPVRSDGLGLRGEIDMVITCYQPDTPDNPVEIIPVDYKLSDKAGAHFKLQLAAYAMLLEEMHGVAVSRGFLYFIELRRAEVILIDKRLRKQVHAAVAAMQQVAYKEAMPPPTTQISKCVSCEFRRFCNDVL